MEISFLFLVFFAGLIVATFQDLKRREVDNWLNLILFFTGVSYFLFSYFDEGVIDVLIFLIVVLFASFILFFSDEKMEVKSSKGKYYLFFFVVIFISLFVMGFLIWFFGFETSSMLIVSAVAMILLFILSNLFFEGRIFGGGDAKLLFALSLFFVGSSFLSTFFNIGFFVLSLMCFGSIYGIFFSVFLYIGNRKLVNSSFRKWARKSSFWYFFVGGLVILLLGIYDFRFLFVGAFLILFILLYVFSKSLEDVVMAREVRASDLRVGDLLYSNLKIGRRILRADWNGLSKSEIELILKSNIKKVKIKEGIPFVPAFFVAFVFYYFFKDYFIGLIMPSLI